MLEMKCFEDHFEMLKYEPVASSACLCSRKTDGSMHFKAQGFPRAETKEVSTVLFVLGIIMTWVAGLNVIYHVRKLRNFWKRKRHVRICSFAFQNVTQLSKLKIA
jgi:hypothetical protein